MHEIERQLIHEATEKRIPINGSVELTPLCNMNCDMCYVRLSREEMERQGRLRTVEEWLSVARQMRDAGTLFLLLTGGEPLIYPDFRRLYLALRNMGFLITINTNGTLIDEDWAAFFGAYKPRRINITLYGADEQAYRELCHYSGGFEKAVNAIKMLRAREIEVKLGGSLTRRNEKHIEQMFELSRELSVPMFMDAYMMPSVRERESPYDFNVRLDPEKLAERNMAILRESLGDEEFKDYAFRAIWEAKHVLPGSPPYGMTCHAGKCSFTVNWQGKMRPCVMMSSPSACVYEIGFAAAWKYICNETDRIVVSSKCGTCSLRIQCRSCAAAALLETGSYDGTPEYLCRYTRETYRQLAGFCMHEMQRRKRDGEEA